MRWSYKTVHYSLKKEGLLGSAFLDEVEVEDSLNEYGSSGWELVSLMELHDGMMAVFKQPLSLGAEEPIIARQLEQAPEFQEQAPVNLEDEQVVRENDIFRPLSRVEDVSLTSESTDLPEDDGRGVGAIRIT